MIEYSDFYCRLKIRPGKVLSYTKKLSVLSSERSWNLQEGVFFIKSIEKNYKNM